MRELISLVIYYFVFMYVAALLGVTSFLGCLALSLVLIPATDLGVLLVYVAVNYRILRLHNWHFERRCEANMTLAS